MAKFKYRARTKGGELQVGFINALTREEATGTLLSHDLYVLLLEEIKRKGAYTKFFDYVNRVKRKDLMIFTRQFATLLSAHIPLDDTLTTLKRQTRNVTLKNVVAEITNDIESGLSLSQSLEKYGHVFSQFYVNMVRSAEVTGRVDESVGFLASYIEKQMELISRVRNALIYPIIVVGLFFLVGGIMVTVVFPQIGPVFEEAGIDLPIFTQILLGGGEFLARWWWMVILAFIVFGVLTYDYFRTNEGKTLRDEVLMRTPVVKRLLRALYVARFSESLGVLIKGGIPIAQAIEITGQTIGNVAYRDVLHSAAGDVRKGEPFSLSLSRHANLFPPLVSQMIAVGESTGRIDELLEKVGEFYTREVDSAIGGLIELIQPLMMVFIGLLVGGLFASILVPIYNLAQTF